jgi:hypothetical protein
MRQRFIHIDGQWIGYIHSFVNKLDNLVVALGFEFHVFLPKTGERMMIKNPPIFAD